MTSKQVPEFECDECGKFRSTDPNQFRKLTGQVLNSNKIPVGTIDKDFIYCADCLLKIVLGIHVEQTNKGLQVRFRKV